MKEKLDEKEEEIGRLKNTIHLNTQSLKAKDEEIEAVRMMSRYEKKAEEFTKDNEVLDLKQSNASLARKVDELLKNQKQLKKEIEEKDRIIMCYVRKPK